MKLSILLLPVVTLAQMTVFAQNNPPVEIVPPSPRTKVVVDDIPPAQPLNKVVVRERLSIAPKAVVTVAPSTVTTPPVATTTTTTVTTTPAPTRVYDVERQVVVVKDRELPYVTVPVLFVVETAQLLNDESRVALEATANGIMEVAKTNPNARFDIEGHTSTEGTDEFNMSLSAARAQRVLDELIKTYGVPSELLSAHGYGENYPKFPNGTESQLQLDRRVLVVRTQ
ncbi:outer membrane protein OmpA-like peptidoglycan-associated protein [Roseimicrobium gellanilyticum]|uniref:Outer membrane protein OmpA-like peptidoglycan-associated protein n=1 Tax=Roseimicrobium gellanilyticum TaxID=748857 RepID=A0A366HRF6_9BACT|nr:OmpA family protein [Roseimicrobium gellanilyticum]RBP45829.1 outer membrane protein OmpA-like peptidoglycan-associated protein [Roseimicrobium gellanilyticum]